MRPLVLLLALCASCSTVGKALLPEPPATAVSVSKPMEISLLPPEVDVDLLIPPVVPVDIKPVGVEFDDEPVDGGKFCPSDTPTKCFVLKPGILVSETTYANSISNKLTLDRLQVESRVLKNLRIAERKAIHIGENAYQTRIVSLEKENTELRKPNVWESLRFYTGFILGAAVTVAIAYGMTQVVR